MGPGPGRRRHAPGRVPAPDRDRRGRGRRNDLRPGHPPGENSELHSLLTACSRQPPHSIEEMEMDEMHDDAILLGGLDYAYSIRDGLRIYEISTQEDLESLLAELGEILYNLHAPLPH